MFTFVRCSASAPSNSDAPGDFSNMTERPVDLSKFPSYGAARRSLFSARRFALMASVVAGLGAAVYGFSPQQGPVDVFTSAAHAQVNTEVRKVERPIGFADIVERVDTAVVLREPGEGDLGRAGGRRRGADPLRAAVVSHASGLRLRSARHRSASSRTCPSRRRAGGSTSSGRPRSSGSP